MMNVTLLSTLCTEIRNYYTTTYADTKKENEEADHNHHYPPPFIHPTPSAQVLEEQALVLDLGLQLIFLEQFHRTHLLISVVFVTILAVLAV